MPTHAKKHASRATPPRGVFGRLWDRTGAAAIRNTLEIQEGIQESKLDRYAEPLDWSDYEVGIVYRLIGRPPLLGGAATPEIRDKAIALAVEKGYAHPKLADAVLTYAVRNNNETAYAKAMEWLAEFRPEEQHAQMKRMAHLLAGYAADPFANSGSAKAVERIARFFEEAVVYLPKDGQDQRIVKGYEATIERMVRIIEDHLPDAENDAARADARLACAKALWALDYSQVEFWLGALTDAHLKDFVVEKFLDMEWKEGMKRDQHGWFHLATRLDLVGETIANSPSNKKWEFFRFVFNNWQEEQKEAVARLLGQMSNVPDDILDRASGFIRYEAAEAEEEPGTEFKRVGDEDILDITHLDVAGGAGEEPKDGEVRPGQGVLVMPGGLVVVVRGGGVKGKGMTQIPEALQRQIKAFVAQYAQSPQAEPARQQEREAVNGSELETVKRLRKLIETEAAGAISGMETDVHTLMRALLHPKVAERIRSWNEVIDLLGQIAGGQNGRAATALGVLKEMALECSDYRQFLAANRLVGMHRGGKAGLEPALAEIGRDMDEMQRDASVDDVKRMQARIVSRQLERAGIK